MLTYTLRAEYKSPADVSDYPMTEVKKGRQALKSLPNQLRECFIVEQMGLLFSKSGGSGYYGNLQFSQEEHIKYYAVKNDAQFVDSNGKAYTFSQVLNKYFYRPNGEKYLKAWREAKQAIGATVEEAVLAEYAGDITKLALQLAKYQLRTLPFKVRDAWFAVYGDMLYMPDGSSAYSGERSETRYGTVNVRQKLITRERKSGAMFTDSKGNELSVDEVWSTFGNTGKVGSALEHINWCASLVGAKDVLALFPKEVRAMRKAGKEAKAAEAEPAELVVAEAAEENEPRGSSGDGEDLIREWRKRREAYIREHESEQVRADAERIVNTLKMWKPECREAWLAEYTGLLFTPDGGDAYEFDKGKDEALIVRRGEVHMMSSSGKELDYHKVYEAADKAAWNDIYRCFQRHGVREAVLAVFAEEYKKMRTATEKRVGRGKQLDRAAERAVAELRRMSGAHWGAMLSERLGLLYMPDGGDGWDRTEHARGGALFIDPDGRERIFNNVIRWVNWEPWYRVDSLKKRYAGLMERIVEAFAPELQAMKATAEKRREERRGKAD